VLKLKVAPNLFVGAPQWWNDVLQRNTEISNRGWLRDAGLDHLRHFKNLFICQPYYIEGEALAKLLEACRAEGLIVKISAISNYWPGHTISLIIFRPVDQQDYHEFVSRIRTSELVVPSGKSLFDGGAR
jgi:hypothetical protein